MNTLGLLEKLAEPRKSQQASDLCEFSSCLVYALHDLRPAQKQTSISIWSRVNRKRTTKCVQVVRTNSLAGIVLRVWGGGSDKYHILIHVSVLSVCVGEIDPLVGTPRAKA